MPPETWEIVLVLIVTMVLFAIALVAWLDAPQPPNAQTTGPAGGRGFTEIARGTDCVARTALGRGPRFLGLRGRLG